MKSAVTISLVEEARGGPFVFWDGLESGIKSASRLGFDAVEIFPPDASTLDAMPVARWVQEAGLAVAAVGTGAGWVKHRLQLADENASVRTAAIDFIRQIIDVAGSLGAPAIIGSMQGRSSPTVPAATAKQHLRDGLAKLADHAKQYGTTLLYEPLNRYETDQANTMAQGASILHGIENVRLLADWFHMNIEESDMAEALALQADLIGHIHFADSNRSAIGFGHISPKPMIDALRKIGYSGYISAEVFPKPTSEEAAAQTIRSFRHWCC